MKMIKYFISIVSGLFLISLLAIVAYSLAEDSENNATSNVNAGKTLRDARAVFKTKIVDTRFVGDGEPASPPKDIFNLIHYPAKDGDMTAFVTPDPKDGKKHPAVIWLIGGYGGIGDDDYLWKAQPTDNDQSGSAFRKAGITLMVPSFRAENANPGHYEMFYGELDDLESARAWLAQQPYIDPDRIYLVGHSTGGTRALLASELSNKYRAVFSLGGIPDLKKRIKAGPMQVNIPFDQTNPQEFTLRSPQFFVNSITQPTFYFEGGNDYWPEFDAMQDKAKKQNVPLFVYHLKNGDHFTIITPVTQMIAEKIVTDTGEKSNIEFSEKDIKVIEKELRQ